MNKYNFRCGCDDACAVTKEQRAYAKRALSMAYTMRDRTAIARIKDALKPCPSRNPSGREFEQVAALALIKAMKGQRN